MLNYRYGSHTVFNIEYHFVFVTKYRYKVLRGDIANELIKIIRKTCDIFEIEIESGVVSPDHVHILVSAPPNISPSEIMRRVKGKSAKELLDTFPVLKKRYWGRHLWARGYFCATSGDVTKEMIEEYLKHHFEPEHKDTFKVEIN